MRFVVTGSGRCGTTYLSRLLCAAGIPCGHESVFDFRTEVEPDWRHYRADSSWQAVPFLDKHPYPTVLIVRDPLKVVNSYVELGFFAEVGESNPVHETLIGFAPECYEQPTEQDAALCMWLALNRGALRHAELIFRIEDFGAEELARLLRWAGADDSRAASVVKEVKTVPNDFPNLRAATGRRCDFRWDDFTNQDLVARARDLAETFGYGEAA